MASLKTVNQQSQELFVFKVCMHGFPFLSEKAGTNVIESLEDWPEITDSTLTIPAGKLKKVRLHVFRLESQSNNHRLI